MGIWTRFSADVRKRKILALACAGGLGRPGECTIALCQALLGVNRPQGKSRLVGALTVLRQVAQILLAQASLPNLLDGGAHGDEAAAFCSAALESMNLARLSELLSDVDVDS